MHRQAINKLDYRYRPPRRYRAIECEAVGQAVLERMLRKVLDAMLPEPLADVQVREERQRAKLLAVLEEQHRFDEIGLGDFKYVGPDAEEYERRKTGRHP